MLRYLLTATIATALIPGVSTLAVAQYGDRGGVPSVIVTSVLLPTGAADPGSPITIDTVHSVLTVHVYKAGAFSAFGHEHVVRAPIQKGAFDEAKGTVDFVVDASTLRVLDADVSDKDRGEIQSTMLGPKVLDSAKFREIRFHSTQVSRSGENRWSIRGELTLHGQTRPVTIDVQGQERRYRGSVRLRQTEFGITPVTAGGGAIKVKDELRIEFEVVGNQGSGRATKEP